MARPLAGLSVVYDGDCAFCIRCADWLLSQPTLLAVELVDSRSDRAQLRFGSLPALGNQLVVVADDGRVWVGPAAFLMCLWALAAYREWSLWLSSPVLAPLARRFFVLLSARRSRLAALFSHRGCDVGQCRRPERGPYRSFPSEKYLQ